MRDSFDKTFGFARIFFVIVFVLIIGMFFFRVSLITSARNEGKTIYEIKVNNFQEVETYMTKEYTRDKETGCISFKDEFGIKHTVCNNYSITEF